MKSDTVVICKMVHRDKNLVVSIFLQVLHRRLGGCHEPRVKMPRKTSNIRDRFTIARVFFFFV